MNALERPDCYLSTQGLDKIKFTLVSAKAHDALNTQSERVRKHFRGGIEKSIVVHESQKNRLIAWAISHDLRTLSI